VREVWVLPWVLLLQLLVLQPASVIDAYLPLLVGVFHVPVPCRSCCSQQLGEPWNCFEQTNHLPLLQKTLKSSDI